MNDKIKFVRHFDKIPSKAEFRLLRIACDLVDELQEKRK
jgi:hypothetical protein